MSDTPSVRRTQTRERLVDAAAQIFADKGVVGASVEEICEAAGFTRGAFYSNFESKDDLCLALLRRHVGLVLTTAHDTIASLETAASEGLPCQDSIDAVIDRAITFFLLLQPADRESILASAELRLYAARSASLRPAYLDLVRHNTEAFGAIIETAAARLGYRLTLPHAQVLALLDGIFEQGALASLIEGETGTLAARSQLMGVVLKSCLAPREASEGCDQPAHL